MGGGCVVVPPALSMEVKELGKDFPHKQTEAELIVINLP